MGSGVRALLCSNKEWEVGSGRRTYIFSSEMTYLSLKAMYSVLLLAKNNVASPAALPLSRARQKGSSICGQPQPPELWEHCQQP